MNTTRRQHYVWRRYLAAWEEAGQVHVARRDGHKFRTNPTNVAVERDFYRLPELRPGDEEFVRNFFDVPAVPALLRELNNGWFELYRAPDRVRKFLRSKGVEEQAIASAVQQAEIMAEEQFHARLESSFGDTRLQFEQGNTSCWDDDKRALQTSFFLATQHFRTKKMQSAVPATFADARQREIVERCWPLFRQIFATNVGWSLYSERKNWRLRSLHAPEGRTFITADQPTHNLMKGTPPEKLALYYPVSPRSAVLLERIDEESAVGSQDILLPSMVAALNMHVAQGSHEQVFGQDPESVSDAYMLSDRLPPDAGLQHVSRPKSA